MPARSHARYWLIAAALWYAACCVVFWPGYALYDSVAQYEQALSGSFDDWHPPIMAVLWRGLHRTVGGGAGPMLAVQLAGWWLGLGLIAGALARVGRRRAAVAALAIGVMPPWFGWQLAVLKDAQMAGALLAAVGLVAWWRLRGRAVPRAAWLPIVGLITYAGLVRANAVFAMAPLAAILVEARPVRRLALGVGLAGLVLIAAGPINHGAFGAARSGVERTEAVFDLAGIAVRVPEADGAPLASAARRALIKKRCVTPYFWDPLGDEARCEADLASLRAEPVGALYRTLAGAIVAHPLAYARHRLSHLNSTERWLVPRSWPGVAPPDGNEPNTLDLREPGGAARAFQHLGGWAAETPLGWPIVWTVLAGAAVAVGARRTPAPARDLALALAASALGQEASFAVLSIASDWRYHLWVTVATALALVLLADRLPPRRSMAVIGGSLAFMLGAGIVARLLLPAPPATYAGMLTAGAGLAF